MGRRNGDWRFAYEVAQTADESQKPQPPGWFKEDFADTSWQSVVGAEWRYPQFNCIAWYRVKFFCRPAPSGSASSVLRRRGLGGGGVADGKRLGSHRVYYEPFRFDVTHVLRQRNTLAVRVASGAAFGEPYEYGQDPYSGRRSTLSS